MYFYDVLNIKKKLSKVKKNLYHMSEYNIHRRYKSDHIDVYQDYMSDQVDKTFVEVYL